MPSQRLVLYTDSAWISPFVCSCFVALHEKILPFETSLISLAENEQLLPGFRDASITARVPALVHGDFWLTESQAIIEYLEEAFPQHPRVLPADIKTRARARQIMAWVRTDLMALRLECPTTTMFYTPTTQPLSLEAQAAAGKLLRVANTLIPETSGPLFGDFCIADADLAFMLQRLIINGHTVPPRIQAFVDAVWARPSVQAFVNRERPPLPA